MKGQSQHARPEILCGSQKDFPKQGSTLLGNLAETVFSINNT